jgi:3-oxoacyl-[acyl-carrier protein] reductase
MSDSQEFYGKRVVITGAAGIFGTWIARAFASKGARLCLCDIREEELLKLASEPIFQETEVIVQQTNLTSPSSIDQLVNLIEDTWSAPDILINNAGIYPRHVLLEMSLEDWEQTINVNVTAPFLLTQKLAKLMIQEEVKGSIINISSGASSETSIGGGHYSTSKAAVAMLTRSFSLELAPFGIRVNAVAPGFAPGSEVSHLSEDYIAKMVESIPLGRTSGPNDAPEAILFLCSEKASFMTGSTIVVDGGRTAGKYKRPAIANGRIQYT